MTSLVAKSSENFYKQAKGKSETVLTGMFIW